MRNLRLYLIALVLILCGLGFFAYKVLALHFPVFPDTTSAWFTIDTRLFFSARSGKSIRAQLLIPQSSNQFIIVDENFILHGYGLSTDTVEGNRAAVWAIRRAEGDQHLVYRAVIQKVQEAETAVPVRKPTVSRPDLMGAQLIAARSILAEIQERSADLETLIAELIRVLDTPTAKGSVGLLMEGSYSSLRKAQTAVTILQLADIPARTVHGLELKEWQRNAPVVNWIEVHDGRTWRSFAIDHSDLTIPENYFAWWRGNDSLFQVRNGENVQVSFDLKRNEEQGVTTAILPGRLKRPLLYEFSLFSLPVDVQGVFRILLVIPLGALIAVLARNVVGLQTFGTFMPILIALAFRETTLVWGCILLIAIVSAGLLIRLSLEHLKLLLIPRLSAVLTIVILLIAAASILTNKLGVDRGISVALFPIVIITMVIERMSIVWDERGPAEACKQGLGSLLVAIAAHLVISDATIKHLMFVFPELNLVVLAIIMLLGRYSGYRLLEIRRFRQLLEKD